RAARAAGSSAGRGVRSVVPEPHDPASAGGDHDGESTLRRGSRRGGTGLQDGEQRVRRSDDRNRADAANARRGFVRTTLTQIGLAMKSFRVLLYVAVVVSLGACASGGGNNSTVAPIPDPRVGLKPGLKDAGKAAWNLKLINNTPPSEKFVGSTNSDLSFYKNYVIQGNYNGFEVWDITRPSSPALKVGYYCPASQSDVSVFRNLLFVSGEGQGGRLDCTSAGVHDSVSHDRLRRIEVIKVPLAAPQQAAVVSSARIFDSLTAPPTHAEMPQDVAEAARVADSARTHGGFTAKAFGMEHVLWPGLVNPLLDSVARSNGRTAATAADSAALRTNIQTIVDRMFGVNQPRTGPAPGPNQ